MTDMLRRPLRAMIVVAAAALAAGACASRHGAISTAKAGGSLETYIEKVRALSANARPQRSGGLVQNLETWDPRLAAALRDVGRNPTAENHRRAGEEYRRLGVLDRAYQHLSAALELAPDDAAAYDSRARIWRDWGVPNLGLPDAYTAAALAPDSAVPANTVGTLLAALGRFDSAREWYARALLLDGGAGYALNNICYADLMLGHREAIGACRRAVAAAPALAAAHNNLGLAYAADGDLDRARTEFAAAGRPGADDFNMGIVFMARQQFRKADAAFAAALRANPSMAVAAERRRQAQAKAANDAEGPR